MRKKCNRIWERWTQRNWSLLGGIWMRKKYSRMRTGRPGKSGPGWGRDECGRNVTGCGTGGLQRTGSGWRRDECGRTGLCWRRDGSGKIVTSCGTDESRSIGTDLFRFVKPLDRQNTKFSYVLTNECGYE